MPKTYFADGEHPRSTRLEAPRDDVKRGTSPRMGHKTAVEGCAEQRGVSEQGVTGREHCQENTCMCINIGI